MSNNEVRDVEIRVRVTKEGRFNGFDVAYIERKKHCRFLAGQFNHIDNTLESVTQWVLNNPKLRLVRTVEISYG